MQKTCPQCKTSFEITDSDLKFYEKVSPVFKNKKYPVLPPTLCPNCRQIRRMASVNDIHLYRRKCDATGKDIVSKYHPDSPHKVYHQEYWWSDQWDPMDYGRNFDFKRPFFEQFYELLVAVPRANVFTAYQYDENSEYTNGAGKNKNCYLIFDADYCRDTYYSYSTNHTTNCLDCYRVRDGELCYENIDCKKCYNSKFLQDCVNCNDSAFLKNCISCKNCFMSFNLQHKQYYIYNRQSTKEEYEKFMALLSSQKNVEKFKNELRTLEAHYPQKYIHGTQNENVSGDYLSNCKNVQQSYDSNDIWDGKYIYQSFGTAIKDSMDCNECGEFTQLMYESSTCGYNANNILFSSYCLDQCSDLLYCDHCHFSSNLFGCVGLRRKKFCILNKQYTQEEYEDVVPKIIEHMKKTGEWGEYFPIKFSPSAYNESLAQDYTPLTKEEARTRGYRWHDDLRQKIAQTYQIPDDIKMVKDDITQTLLACKECGINFKIIPQELAFYKHQNIPIPNKCFYCRHRARRLSRNPRKLWARTCAKCNTSIQTSYTPERPEMVLCEKCYLETVY